MTIKLVDNASRRARRRVQRHGYEYDFVWEQFINGKPAPFGLLFKSHKTNRYAWYDRKQLKPIKFYDGEIIPDIIEGIKIYTDNKAFVYEYLDHLIKNVLSKRDCKRFGPIYEKVKEDQLSLLDRLNS